MAGVNVTSYIYRKISEGCFMWLYDSRHGYTQKCVVIRRVQSVAYVSTIVLSTIAVRLRLATNIYEPL